MYCFSQLSKVVNCSFYHWCCFLHEVIFLPNQNTTKNKNHILLSTIGVRNSEGSDCNKFTKFTPVTLMPLYHCHKPVFRPKMAIFRRAGMREGGLPLPLAFQYLILMIWRVCDLDLAMISLLASKWQDFKLRGLQFHL